MPALQVFPGGVVDSVAPRDPAVGVLDDGFPHMPGDFFRIEAFATPGSAGLFLFGLDPVLVPLPTLGLDLLVDPTALLPMAFPESGAIEFALKLPAVIGSGQKVMFQLAAVDPSGTVRASASNFVLGHGGS